VNQFQPIFDKQKDYFNTDATKSYEWRIGQLDRMAKMLNENNEAFQEAVSKDFKTALEEKVFEVAAPLATIKFTKMQLREWMKPISAKVPKALAASGHTAQVIREPYGVTLVIGPFNGPLILLLDPASNKRRKRNQSISDRKPREAARRHVATEGFCVARVAGSGSCCPQYAQFARVGSTGLSHFGHVGCSKVPQREQNGNFAFSICPQPGHGFGRGSRRMKYKIIPIAFGMKIASSVHITYRICRRFASP
jgi:hypothetical protein